MWERRKTGPPQEKFSRGGPSFQIHFPLKQPGKDPSLRGNVNPSPIIAFLQDMAFSCFTLS
jgi:hypothetical protein